MTDARHIFEMLGHLRRIDEQVRHLRRDVSTLRTHLDQRLDRSHERQDIMDARIRSAIDEIGALKSVAQSVEAAIDLQTGMITDQGKQIEDLKAQLANGSPVTEADLAELATANTDLAQVTQELGAKIPQSTPIAPPA